MKVLHEWLQDYVGERMPSVKEVEDLLTFHAFEIEGTEVVNGKLVIDVKVLPDRGADCLSHRGIAREIATLTGNPLANDPLTREILLAPATGRIDITVEDKASCPRFGAALISGVSVTESPEWLKERLAALGHRSINNIVDATNYVMLALGQPLHAYDAARFEPDGDVWRFGVRMGRDGEEVVILGGATVKLSPEVQVIVNGKTDVPVGIAGVKGGKSAEIDQSTTTVILEAANFNPRVTRRGAARAGLQTDASKRFENNISALLVPHALVSCVELIREIAGGTCEGYADHYEGKSEHETVEVKEHAVNALLGLSLQSAAIEDILSRLGFFAERKEGGWSVQAPFERRDISIPEDVIAEIGRVYGYEHIASVVPEAAPLPHVNARHYYSEKIRRTLVEEGFSEVITSSFRNRDHIELANALASDKRYLRSTLRENMKEVLDRNVTNLDLLQVDRVLVFEIGTVFERTEDGSDVAEHVSVCIGVRTKQQGPTPHDDEHVREVSRILSEELGCSIDGSPQNGILEFDLTRLLTKLPSPQSYDPYEGGVDATFVPYSQYPFISRDLALWVPEGVASTDVESMLRSEGGELLVRVRLFDEFKKEDKVSYAFRLVFQSFDRTLTDEEIGVIMTRLEEESRRLGYTPR